MELVSTLICEDVLGNPAGRLSLYNVFGDLTADRFPASVRRLHVVTTWYSPSQTRSVIQVSIVSPGGEVIGTAISPATVASGYYTQISRFQDLIFPEPGEYRIQVQRDDRVICDWPLTVSGPEGE